MAGKYRVAVVGDSDCGGYGHGIDNCWLEIPATQIVAVADPVESGRADRVQTLGAEQGFADYREMLDTVKPDIVGIGPRWVDQRHEMIMAVAERGIHMYVEKPFCRNLQEADDIVAACEKHDVKLGIAHQTRYSPKIQVIRDLIEDGEIGHVLELRGRGKEDGRGGGEDLWVLGTHILNLVHVFAGEPNWCSARVLQDGIPVTKEHVYDGNEGIGPLAGDNINAMWGMDGGVTAHFATHRDRAGNPRRFGLQILGSKGIIEIVTGYLPLANILKDPSWSPVRSGQQWEPISSAGVGQPEPLQGDNHDGNVVACRDLIQAIEEDRLPEGNVYEARMAVEMIASVFESHRTGCIVPMPLENRQNPLTLLN